MRWDIVWIYFPESGKMENETGITGSQFTGRSTGESGAMKRKWFCIIGLIAACAVFLAACQGGHGNSETGGESDGIEAEESGKAAEAAKPKIGVSVYRYDDNFMKLYRQELKQYLEESYGAEVTVRNARDSQVEQDEQVQGFIEAGCDGILINVVEVSSAGRIADLCRDAGIPLVFINREPDEAEQERWEAEGMNVSCVGTDSRQAGTYQGEIILEMPDRGDLNGDGKVSYVMIMGEDGNSDSKYRTEASVLALKNGGMETENLFSGHGDWLEERGKELAVRALERYQDRVEVIFCNNDAMANGAYEAVTEAGRKPGQDLYIVGVDALEETVRYIKEGKITGTVLNDHTGQSHKAADVLFAMINGENVENRYLVDYVKITSAGALPE